MIGKAVFSRFLRNGFNRLFLWIGHGKAHIDGQDFFFFRKFNLTEVEFELTGCVILDITKNRFCKKDAPPDYPSQNGPPSSGIPWPQGQADSDGWH